MITVPQLPTDNVYKFIAVFGFLCFGSGLVGPVLVKLNRQNYEDQVQVERDERVLRYTDLQIKLMQADPTLADPAARHTAQQKFTADLAEEQRAAAAWKIERRHRLSDSWLYYSLLARIVGGVLCVLGFRLWYTRYQRPQDRILAAQEEKEAGKPKTRVASRAFWGRFKRLTRK